MYDKLSLHIYDSSILVPFISWIHVFFFCVCHHQERGAEKEKRLAEELLQKQLEEESARIPRAYPYPYTTDYPVVCIHVYLHFHISFHLYMGLF